MSNEIKKELTPYYIELKSDITPKQYLDSNEGASIKNDSIIFFIRDNEEIEISKRIRDIWIKDSEGITHLMSGYGRFFHRNDNDYSELELASGDRAGLISPELIKNINAIIAMTDLEGQESKFNNLESSVNENTKNIKELGKRLTELNENIESIVVNEMNKQRDSFVSQIKGEFTNEIENILNNFINHTHKE